MMSYHGLRHLRNPSNFSKAPGHQYYHGFRSRFGIRSCSKCPEGGKKPAVPGW
jgi:hypothetical protein